jgi:hypothetical protein
MSTEPAGTVARITVERPQSGYRVLKVAAAAAGDGVSMSSVIRDLVHEYVEALQDEADLALVLELMADPRPRLSKEDLRTHLAERRATT